MTINYTDKITQRFFNPQHVGSLEDTQDTGIGEVGSLACGDIIKLFIKVQNNIIVDAKVLVFGCVSAFASAEYMIEIIKYKTIEQALLITNNEICKFLELPTIKIHCSVLAQEAIAAAIKNYTQKQSHTQETQYIQSNIMQYNIQRIRKLSDNVQTTSTINISQKAHDKFEEYFKHHKDKALFIYLVKEKCGYTIQYKITAFSYIQRRKIQFIYFSAYTLAILKTQRAQFHNFSIDIIEDQFDSRLKFTIHNITQYCMCGAKFKL